MGKMRNGLNFDRAFWPEGGTKLNALPADLNDLWSSHEDQCATFVAEALLSEKIFPNLCVDGGDDDPRMHLTIYLWDVGGDTLTYESSLDELIDKFSQADGSFELCGQIAALEKTAATINVALDRLRALAVEQEKLEQKLETRDG